MRADVPDDTVVFVKPPSEGSEQGALCLVIGKDRFAVLGCSDKIFAKKRVLVSWVI